MFNIFLFSSLHVLTPDNIYRSYFTMISLKTFHLFFIGVSIFISGYYGLFEIINPTNPGMASNILSASAFVFTAGLILYGINIIKKFKKI